MRINNPKKNYLAYKNTSLSEILIMFKKNKGLPIVISNHDQTLLGIISKGDLINTLSKLKDIKPDELNAEVFVNKYPVVGHLSDTFETIQGYLQPSKINSLPILDQSRKIRKIITKESPAISFKEKEITEKSNPYLIAEIGVNHNGDLKNAKELILDAAESGCDAVKFQYRSQSTYAKDDLNSFDLGTQYMLSEIKKTNLSIEELVECNKYANNLGIETIITPFDEVALEEIVSAKMSLSAIKIASCDLTNLSLIKKASEIELPLILSTGMSYEREILNTSKFLLDLMVEHAFLHCNSTYPSPVEDVNLKYIPRLSEITNVIVGFSSHDGNLNIPLNSISYGAKIIEFHITKSKKLKGTDHRASIETHKLKEFVDQSKILCVAAGNGFPRKPSQGELANKLSLGKSFALNKNKFKGEKIKENDLILLSPGSGFNYGQIDMLIGKTLKNDCLGYQIIKPSDIENSSNILAQDIKNIVNKLTIYGYKVGIPVRYHDLVYFKNLFNTSMIEFHMSDRDLDLDPKNYLATDYSNIDLIVHGVEQFEDGFIFDLASDEQSILKRSFFEVERLVRHLDDLRKYFKDVRSIPIVINLGGFTKDSFIDEGKYDYLFEKTIDNLNKINVNFPGYEFMPQTMPPFPWHQGGRSYHNLLTNLKKIKDFIDNTKNKICLDISHTAMSCYFFKESISDHINLCGNRIGQIHLSDAQGASAEGLEVGNGCLDFKEIHKAIKKNNDNVFIIPEIWQGHLQGGQPFYRSLKSYLENIE